MGWALPAMALILTCGYLGLFEPTDARYAEVAREMVAGGNWLIPHLNGLAHLDKPPLAYWFSAAGMVLLGIGTMGARIGVAFAGAAALWLVSLVARRSSAEEGATHATREANLAALFLASTCLFFVLGHLLSTDVYLTAAVTAFYAAWFARGGRGHPWLHVAMAAGFLAKGPVVFVHTLLPVAIAAIWLRDRTSLDRLARPQGWALFAVLALPWYIAAVVATPGLLLWLLHHQLWQRYATTVHSRAGPPYYFVGVLLAGALPWTASALSGAVRTARTAARDRVPSGAVLLAWAFAPILFFSTAGSKLPAYILPEFPALAILAARGQSRRGRAEIGITSLLLLGLAATLELAGPRLLARWVGAEHAMTLPLPRLAHLAAAGFLAGGIACAVRAPVRAALLTLGAWYALLGAAGGLEGALGSPAPMARVLEGARGRGAPVIELQTFSAALPFYLRETLPMVEVPREDRFETEVSRDRAFLDRSELPALVLARGRTWVVAPPGKAEAAARTLGLRYEILVRSRAREIGSFERPDSVRE